jgi:hypothetical protein
MPWLVEYKKPHCAAALRTSVSNANASGVNQPGQRIARPLPSEKRQTPRSDSRYAPPSAPARKVLIETKEVLRL